MSRALRLTFWMNMPSPYQADFFREVASHPGVQLDVIFARELDPMRTRLGWSFDNGGFASQQLPTRRRVWTAMLRAWERRDGVHVINGVWALPEFVAAAAVLLLAGAPVFFHAEVPDPRERRTGVRRWVRDALGCVFLRSSRGIFAISRMAEDFYARLASQNRVIPFGYFKHHRFESAAPRDGAGREVLFVGQLIPRKGVDLLVEAFSRLATQRADVQLVLAGTGPLAESLSRRIEELGLESRVKLIGAVSSAEIDDRIRSADMLVLPSHFDGWGLVVNEALAAGVPAIVTSQCGAADLLHGPEDGTVIPPGDIAALEAALLSRLDASRSLRPDVVRWRQQIGLPAVAGYFLDVVRKGSIGDHVRAPWQTGMGSPQVERSGGAS